MGPTDIKSMSPTKRKSRKSILLETRIVLAQLARKRTRSHDATLPKKPVNEPKFYFPKDIVEDLDEAYDIYELGATCSPIRKKDARKRSVYELGATCSPILKKYARKRRKRKKIEMDIVETRDPDGTNHVTETETDTKQEGKHTEMKKDENEGDEEGNSNEETEPHAYVTEAGRNKMGIETTSGHEEEMYEKIGGIANSSVSDIDDLSGIIHDEPPILEQDQPTKPPVVEETCTPPPPCMQQSQPEPLESGSSVSDIGDLLGRIHDEPPMLEQDQPTKLPVVEETCTPPPPCMQQSRPELLESGGKMRSPYRSPKNVVGAGRNTMDKDMFIDMLIEHVTMGTLRKTKFTTKICSAIIDKFSKMVGKTYNDHQTRNKYYKLRQRYMNFKALIRHPEFAWDSTTHSLTADKEVWEEFVKAHSWAELFRKTGCPDYSKLCIIFGDLHSNQTTSRASRRLNNLE